MKRSNEPPKGEPVVPTDDQATPDAEVEASLPPGAPVTNDEVLDERTVGELEELAAQRGVRLTEGSGKDGAVVKADLVDAIADIPEPPTGRPPLSVVAESAAAIPTPTTTED